MNIWAESCGDPTRRKLQFQPCANPALTLHSSKNRLTTSEEQCGIIPETSCKLAQAPAVHAFDTQAYHLPNRTASLLSLRTASLGCLLGRNKSLKSCSGTNLSCRNVSNSENSCHCQLCRAAGLVLACSSAMLRRPCYWQKASNGATLIANRRC